MQFWLIACCSILPVSLKHHISVPAVRFLDVCGCVIAEHTESLKGQTQSYSAVGLFSHKSLMSKFAFHLKEALYYKVMVDKIMALLRIIY